MSQVDVSAAFTREANRISTIAGGASKAIERAAGTLARRLPVQARRDIQDQYNLPLARIRHGLSATRGGGYVELRASGRGIGLINFGGKWGGRKTPGAEAKVFAKESAYNYGGTFIAKGRSGNKQIFDRTSRKRLPLKVLYGPSLASMLKNLDRKARLALYAQDILSAEFTRLNKARD